MDHLSPEYLYKNITSGSEQPNTRQAVVATAAMATAGMPKQPSLEDCDLGLKKKSWCWSSVMLYKQLPIDLRAEKKMNTFKTRLKQWVTSNVEI